MTGKAPKRPVIVLRLRPEPGVEDIPRVLRQALKLLLRKCRLRCVGMREEKPKDTGCASPQRGRKPARGYGGMCG